MLLNVQPLQLYRIISCTVQLIPILIETTFVYSFSICHVTIPTLLQHFFSLNQPNQSNLTTISSSPFLLKLAQQTFTFFVPFSWMFFSLSFLCRRFVEHIIDEFSKSPHFSPNPPCTIWVWSNAWFDFPLQHKFGVTSSKVDQVFVFTEED